MGRENIQQLKIGVSSVLWGKYMVIRKIGEGGYGAIFEMMRLTNPSQRYAMKVEPLEDDKSKEYLKMEFRVMQRLQQAKAQHAVQVVQAGKEINMNFSYLIMCLLGPSIGDITAMLPTNCHSLYTITVCLIQCVDAIKEVHDIGFLHRDIKPSNFSVGRMNTVERKWVFLLDFGLCRQYLYDESSKVDRRTIKSGSKHIREPRKQVPARGTLRYMSLAAHNKEDLGRHDDLWSLWYMLVEMKNGELPWSKKEKGEALKLKGESLDELKHGLPRELADVARHLEKLKYKDEPDYNLLRNLGIQLFYKNKFDISMPLDWEPGAEHAKVFYHMHHYTVFDPQSTSKHKKLDVKREKEEEILVLSGEHNEDLSEGNSEPDDTMEGLVELEVTPELERDDTKKKKKNSNAPPQRPIVSNTPRKRGETVAEKRNRECAEKTAEDAEKPWKENRKERKKTSKKFADDEQLKGTQSEKEHCDGNRKDYGTTKYKDKSTEKQSGSAITRQGILQKTQSEMSESEKKKKHRKEKEKNGKRILKEPTEPTPESPIIYTAVGEKKLQKTQSARSVKKIK